MGSENLNQDALAKTLESAVRRGMATPQKQSGLETILKQAGKLAPKKLVHPDSIIKHREYYMPGGMVKKNLLFQGGLRRPVFGGSSANGRDPKDLLDPSKLRRLRLF